MTKIVRNVVAVLFVLLGIVLAFVAYRWFSGRFESRHQRRVTVVFDDVTGLQVDDPVQMHGVPVGKVLRIKLDGGKVKCVVGLDRDILPTEDTKFEIRSVSYLTSDRYIALMLGSGPAAGNNYVFDGANEAQSLNQMLIGLQRDLADFHPSELGKEVGDRAGALVKDISSQLGQLSAGLKPQLGQFGSQMERLNVNLAATAGELNRLGGMMDSLRGLVASGSTAGKLLDTDELYQEVRQTNQQVQALLEDIRKDPSRYIKITVF